GGNVYHHPLHGISLPLVAVLSPRPRASVAAAPPDGRLGQPPLGIRCRPGGMLCLRSAGTHGSRISPTPASCTRAIGTRLAMARPDRGRNLAQSVGHADLCSVNAAAAGPATVSFLLGRRVGSNPSVVGKPAAGVRVARSPA